jgi:hypothetical protein
LFDQAAARQHGAVACLEYEITVQSRYLIQIPHSSCVNITMVPALMAGAAVGFAEGQIEFAAKPKAERLIAPEVRAAAAQCLPESGGPR